MLKNSYITGSPVDVKLYYYYQNKSSKQKITTKMILWKKNILLLKKSFFLKKSETDTFWTSGEKKRNNYQLSLLSNASSCLSCFDILRFFLRFFESQSTRNYTFRIQSFFIFFSKPGVINKLLPNDVLIWKPETFCHVTFYLD